jgi:release factor glutamine methyltransferase
VTLADWLAEASRQLTRAGRNERESRQDLAALARWQLGWTSAEWLARQRDDAPTEFADMIAPLVARRALGEPIAYLTGEREFYGRTFRVSPDVLIPRPETELVLSETLACLNERERGASGPPVIVDVGTGSGCIAVTIALEHPAAKIIATDISAGAIAVAEDNARRLGAADRITFRHGGLLAGVNERVDLIVSNPPYIATADRASLAVDVVSYEPAAALFAGEDGLLVVRQLIVAAAASLRSGGWLVMEIGLGQANDVAQFIAEQPHLSLIRIQADLQQIPRAVVARSL